MNREIKFRGKRIENGEWVKGAYFCLHHNDGRQHIHHFIIPDNTPIPKDKPIGEIQVEVDPATVGQFAGEIQGQQVYEGDVIEFIDSFYGDFDKRTEKTVRGYVVWENHYAHNFLCFMIHVPQKTPFRVLQNITPWNRRKEVRTYLRTHHCALKDNSKFQVIGNLHDNPELLEQSSC